MSVNNNDRNLDEENQFVSSTSSRVEPNCQHDFERIASSKNEGTFNLSEREQEVLNLLVQGQANKDIAATLYVCEKTVEFHLTNLYAKLNVQSRAQAVSKAITQDSPRTRDFPS